MESYSYTEELLFLISVGAIHSVTCLFKIAFQGRNFTCTWIFSWNFHKCCSNINQKTFFFFYISPSILDSRALKLEACGPCAAPKGSTCGFWATSLGVLPQLPQHSTATGVCLDQWFVIFFHLLGPFEILNRGVGPFLNCKCDYYDQECLNNLLWTP